MGCVHATAASFRAQAAAALVCADRVVAGLSGRSRHGQNKNGGRRGGRGPSERGAHLYARVPPGHFFDAKMVKDAVAKKL